MDVPPIPSLLTEADWNKNKGAIAKAAGKTGLGQLLKDLTLAYHRVDWDALDVEKALDSADTAAEAKAALAVAKRQFQVHVPPLLKKIEAVEEQARETQSKFAKHKLIPAASVRHVGKLADAAEQFATDVKAVEDSFEAFEKAVAARVKREKDAKAELKPGAKTQATPAVKDVAGEKWFAGLAKISLHRDPAVARWAFNADIAASADDGLFRLDRRFDPRGAQDRFEAQLKKFRVLLEQLKGLKDRPMERKEAVVKLQIGSRDLAQSFATCLLSVEDLVEVMQTLRSRAAGAYETWHDAHPDVPRQSEQALAVLKKQQPLVEELNQFVHKLKKD